MTFQQLLEVLRTDSITEREKGTKFEKLIKAWLLADPRYKDLTHVWLWEEFPSKADFGGTDLGIDLVARTNDGEYWSIQCKFYAEKTIISKSSIDSFISNSYRTFTDPITNAPATKFSNGFLVSTKDEWGSNAEEIVHNQAIKFSRIGLPIFDNSVVDWQALLEGKPQTTITKSPLEHQLVAMQKAHDHYHENDRGKLIMACGTGKTYTSLSIIEQETKGKGRILFMVPSIALLGQSLNEWMADTKFPMKAICICSDSKASRNTKKSSDDVDNSILDLARPATTNSASIAKQFEKEKDFDGLLVVFSTYQSIDAVSEAQKAIKEKIGEDSIFDWIVCDEAHRTTGVKLSNADESAFTKIHDDTIVQGRKRLYMTATPRLYGDGVKAKAKENDHVLCSMDNEEIYGKEFHRIGFSEAVQKGLLTDYKVLVLTVGSEKDLPANIRDLVRDEDNKEFDLDMVSRLIGCINGLSKVILGDKGVTWEEDPCVMRRALAFCPNINKAGDLSSSMQTAKSLPIISQSYYDSLDEGRKSRTVKVVADHIDGSMNSQTRAQKLAWLKEEAQDPNECRLLSNVRCLSEGVDVPALDAVVFLSARNSQVDVVQSVGRVMRNFRKGQEGEKKYGYIIIPVVVKPNIPAEEALNDNERFKVVWLILNALRSHDDGFNAIVNKINLNKSMPAKITVGTVPPLDFPLDDNSLGANERELIAKEQAEALQGKMQQQLSFFAEMRDGIYSKLVEKVGTRLYWENWAKEVGIVAQNLIARISELVEQEGQHQDDFNDYLSALRENINSTISEQQAIEMIAQHLITRPVFESLFTDYNFANNNPVGRSMEKIIDSLIAIGFEKDTAVLNKFYDFVRINVDDIDNLEGKQSIAITLYEQFFKSTSPKTVDKLGIVYTPVECVDFILHSVDDILKKEFNCGLTDENIHILDPFTGTGTFITRLLQSGIIEAKDLERKYLHEIHCNELVLLAYYVADVNIEAVFHDITKRKEYLRYDNICLTDTFDLAEKQEKMLYQSFKDNSAQIENQRKTPIRVIVGNPPYSAKQGSANDNAQNLKYTILDKRIEETYVARSTSTLRNSLYDSYIKAFRWASDRVRKNNESGVIGFITNGGWLEGIAASGFRQCLEEEFSSIYVFHLRGDASKKGEARRQEKDNVFASGSKAPVIITILVYNPKHKGKADIFYHDIGDYLKREEKLSMVKDYRSILSQKIEWKKLEPNVHGDWVTQRSNLLDSYIPIGDKDNKTNLQKFFVDYYSRGLATSRDPWAYNFSREVVAESMKAGIEFYNNQCESIKSGNEIQYDTPLFSWDRQQKKDVIKDKKYTFVEKDIKIAMYRPFIKEYVYYNRQLTNCVYQMPQMFPTVDHGNLVICINGLATKKAFSCFITDVIPDVQLQPNGQCFPLYYYTETSKHAKDTKSKQVQNSLLDVVEQSEEKYVRRDGITDWILKEVRSRFQNARAITKEHIFYYVYGILHSKDYRERFNDDFKKILARIPIVEKIEDFMDFSIKGKQLAELHLNYESIPPHPDVIVSGAEGNDFIVEKMKFPKKDKKDDKSIIIYNSSIRLENIPLETYNYVINGQSAIEWILERYKVTTHVKNGIVNNPNDWATEHDKPRYILDLLLSVINVSTQTLAVVDSLPKLTFEE